MKVLPPQMSINPKCLIKQKKRDETHRAFFYFSTGLRPPLTYDELSALSFHF